MKLRHNLLMILLVLSGPAKDLAAQTANVFFHQGAKLYIAGNFPEALRAVESGLQRRPADAKLQALRDKIKEEMEKQQEQSQSGADQQNQPDQQKQDEQKQDQQEQQQQNEKQQEEQQPTQQRKKDKEQLSKEDAARLLEALKNQEKEAQKQRQLKVQGRVRVDKDW